MRAPMDCFTNPLVGEIVLMAATQVGKTELLLNVVGRTIDQDPCPMLMVQPTLDMAEAYSKERIAPTIRDTPCLREKVGEAMEKKGNDTIRSKVFPGGFLALTGANSPAGLASRPIKILLLDEIDKYNPTKSGDPVDLAELRTETFWDAKIIKVSSPEYEATSRIKKAYQASDMRKYHVPCTHCGKFQVLMKKHMFWPDDKPGEAYYVCEHCGVHLDDGDKIEMVRNGKWIAEKPFNGTAGFWLNGLNSPWRTFGKIAKDFVNASKGGPEKLRVYVNSVLAETWKEQSDEIDEHMLSQRRETYEATVPAGVGLLTAAVDMQGDRLEYEVIGWGKQLESWGIERGVVYGDPKLDAVWDRLYEQVALRTWTHASGVELHAIQMGVDSGGATTDQAYNFCKKHELRGVYALKGVSGFAKETVSLPSKSNKAKINLFKVGVDSAKRSVYSYLNIDKPGPGYCHFPKTYGTDFFKQVTAESLIKTFDRSGYPFLKWHIPSGRPNEALDIRVYNLAVLYINGLNKVVDIRVDELAGKVVTPPSKPARKIRARMKR